MQNSIYLVEFIAAYFLVVFVTFIMLGGAWIIIVTTLRLIFNVDDKIKERLNEWISTDKDLPDCSGTYLVTAVVDSMVFPKNIPEKIVRTWEYDSENGNWIYYGYSHPRYKVIAWKNLPEGYRDF